jgi:hypothetical protein
MLCFVDYGKGYHIAQLEPMGTIFARSVACAQSLKFGGILQDVLQKSKPLPSTIIEGRIGHQNHGGPSQEDENADDVASEADESDDEGSA